MSKPITIIEKMKIYLYILKLFFHRTKRTKETIDDDYEKTTWSNNFTNFEIDSSLVYSKIKRNDSVDIVVRNNRLYKENINDYNDEYSQQFIEELLKFVNKDDMLVEAGCGIGSKLFVLAKQDFTNLYGIDVSKNAINVAKQYNLKKNYNIQFNVADITQEIDQEVFTNKVILTYTCMEQLKHYMRQTLLNIINAKPKLVIHFEVDFNNSPLMVKLYFNVRDYQNNLVNELKKLESENKLEIIYNKKLLLSTSPVNRLSCIVWKPKTASVVLNMDHDKIK